MTFWCHGVTMKWLPSHVAARGSKTCGTIKSRKSWGWSPGGPGWAQRPNPPPPSPAPMKSGISRSVADDKSVSVCPGLFPRARRGPGVKTDTETDTGTEGWALQGSLGPTCTYCPDLGPLLRSNRLSPDTVGDSNHSLHE